MVSKKSDYFFRLCLKNLPSAQKRENIFVKSAKKNPCSGEQGVFHIENVHESSSNFV